MKQVLGIDVGGTNIKFGLVDNDGNLTDKIKYPTADLMAKGDFVLNFVEIIQSELKKHPKIKHIGIGVPGLISKDGLSIVKAPNIPAFDGADLIKILKNKTKGKTYAMENDANAAALGEFVFNKKEVGDNFLMITLGTGVGGGAVIDGKLFRGGSGNAMEIGHIYGGKGRSIEEEIGKKGIVRKANKLIKKNPKSVLAGKKTLDAKKVAKAALGGDIVGIKVFEHVGKYLGQCIVSGVRVLDLHSVIIGGGVSETFPILESTMMDIINDKLGPYYTSDLKIHKATLGNDAGILGAASLVL